MDKPSETPSKPEGEKLQKVLARHGLGSRRGMEVVISEGRVTVNGKVAKLGERVTHKDKIIVDGEIISSPTKAEIKSRVIVYNKPEGQICSRNDPEGRPTVFADLPELSHGRWIAIGRLDLNTQGLLLFTNDGELANRLMHPSYEVERVYKVRIFGELTDLSLRNLTEGVQLEDGLAKFDTVLDNGGKGSNHWYEVRIREGRNREVRRLWESQGVTVSRLIRIGFAGIGLPRELAQGRYRDLPSRDLTRLMKLVRMDNQKTKR